MKVLINKTLDKGIFGQRVSGYMWKLVWLYICIRVRLYLYVCMRVYRCMTNEKKTFHWSEHFPKRQIRAMNKLDLLKPREKHLQNHFSIYKKGGWVNFFQFHIIYPSIYMYLSTSTPTHNPPIPSPTHSIHLWTNRKHCIFLFKNIKHPYLITFFSRLSSPESKGRRRSRRHRCFRHGHGDAAPRSLSPWSRPRARREFWREIWREWRHVVHFPPLRIFFFRLLWICFSFCLLFFLLLVLICFWSIFNFFFLFLSFLFFGRLFIFFSSSSIFHVYSPPRLHFFSF